MDSLARCVRCDTPYHPDKSTSSLRMTWCSQLCEVADLGFHLNTWINQPVKERPVVEPLGVAAESEVVPA